MQVHESLIQVKHRTVSVFNNFFIDSVRDLTHGFGMTTKDIILPNHDLTVFKISEVSESYIIKILSQFKSSRAKDVFNCDSVFVKTHANVLSTPVTHLVNLSIKQCHFPSAWKSAVIAPIFKNGDLVNVINYRPISILPVVSKVIEKVVCNQLVEHLNHGPFPLHCMQYGFRVHHSTETANCYFVEQIKSSLDRGGVVGAVFLDFKKAFDTVNHNVLLSKLSRFNFSTNTLTWMESYLNLRKQCTRINDACSPFLDCNIGVPQGSILGPILFSLYINDLPTVCPEVQVQMYADDTVVYTYAKTKEQAAIKLTAALNKVSDWLRHSFSVRAAE